MSSIKLLITILLVGLSLSACNLVPPSGFPTENHVNIERFMGPWYVIAHIPPDKVKNAYNAVERYKRVAPGKIKTVFSYRDGSFDGEHHTMKPTGYVIKGTGNAVWGMQFFWPVELQYVVSYVDGDYDTAIIARAARDYVWILARTPSIPDKKYEILVNKVSSIGYDVSKLRRVPQQPLNKRDDP